MAGWGGGAGIGGGRRLCLRWDGKELCGASEGRGRHGSGLRRRKRESGQCIERGGGGGGGQKETRKSNSLHQSHIKLKW